MDIAYLRTWIGRTETATDVAALSPLMGLAALLDHETPPWRPGVVPPLGHWLNFPQRPRQSDIAIDGLARRGGFLPPIELPRRMWAGYRVGFLAPIRIGSAIERRSTIIDVSAKTGSSGEMAFVTVRHEISAGDGLIVVEEQDIVYRAAPTGAGSVAAGPAKEAITPRSSAFTRRIMPDAVQLFRYSALTFNGHRIHYDRDYARDVEGYPGLVVHGPYSATLLMDHLLRHRSNVDVISIDFRARLPLFDTAPFDLCLAETPAGFDLWTLNCDGQVCMTANAKVR